MTSKFVFGEDNFEEVRSSNLLTGATQSDCKLPCTSVAAKTRHLMSLMGSSSELENVVDLIQSNSIKVTETKIISTPVSESLAELVRFIMKNHFKSSFVLGGMHGIVAWVGNTPTSQHRLCLFHYSLWKI